MTRRCRILARLTLIALASLMELTPSDALSAANRSAATDVDMTCAVAVPIAIDRGIIPTDATIDQLRPVATVFRERASSASRHKMENLRRRIVANLDSADPAVATKEAEDTRKIVGECVAVLGFDFITSAQTNR